MKKFLPIAFAAILLFSPVCAVAGIIGEANLIVVDYTHPANDYDGAIQYPAGDGPYVPIEMFCVEHADLGEGSNPYTLLSIDEDLSDFGLSVSAFKEAAWLADYWELTWPGTGETYIKVEAQKAIWKVTGVHNYIGGSGEDYDMLLALDAYESLNDILEYDASGWLLAVNPTVAYGDDIEIEPLQNFLVPSPVPEPATMVLLGTGLIGLAGLRKKIKRSKN